MIIGFAEEAKCLSQPGNGMQLMGREGRKRKRGLRNAGDGQRGHGRRGGLALCIRDAKQAFETSLSLALFTICHLGTLDAGGQAPPGAARAATSGDARLAYFRLRHAALGCGFFFIFYLFLKGLRVVSINPCLETCSLQGSSCRGTRRGEKARYQKGAMEAAVPGADLGQPWGQQLSCVCTWV